MTSNVKILDPVQGLVDYVLDIKPYHTKIMEVLIEYVYNEPIDVIISDSHTMQIDLLQPTPGELTLFCESGYAGRPFGDYNQYPIISPNQSIEFENYPAINAGTNSIIVPGNRSTDLQTGSTIYVSTFIDTFIFDVDHINNEFLVTEDHTSEFNIGSVFEVIGSYQHNANYVISSVTFDGTYTRVGVSVQLIQKTFNTPLGSIRNAGNNTGIYTVSTAVYNGGSIDSWPNVSDPNTYLLGDDPHTIITLLEPLNDLPAISDNQVYIASMTINPVLVEGALFYSNYLPVYDSANNTRKQNPDEGYLTQNIVGVVLSTLDGFGYPIPDTGKITIPGNITKSNVFINSTFKINNSVGNNGTYTITSITYDSINDQSMLGVAELIDNSTVDGNIVIDVASNVFIVHGDFRNRFTQGVQFNIVGGNKSGTYTTLTSDYVDGKTRIRVTSDIFDHFSGYDITSVTSNTIVLDGNVVADFGVGIQFNIIDSSLNDGRYVVSSSGSSYDSVTNKTTINIDETIELVADGSVHLMVVGVIKDASYGYSESSDLCGNVSDTVVRVLMHENLRFDGLGPSMLTLTDDIIAYNIENTDTGGFELPINTILSLIQPDLPEQPTPPTSSLNALWFDTTTNIFRQYNGYEWQGIVTAWWFDTTNNLLYYRTKNSMVDTNWILDFQSDSSGVPGHSQVSPAIGETDLIDEQIFVIDDLGGGTPQDTFIFNTPVPNTDKTLIKVTINGVMADFTLNNSTEITILAPFFKVDDIVQVSVYDRILHETNARSQAMSIEPHTSYHDFVDTDVNNNAYIVGGGNFINRFTTATHFDAVIEGSNVGSSVFSYDVDSFPITDVNVDNNTITIANDYTWLFTANRIFKVQTTENNYNEFEIVDSTLVDNETVITVVQSVIETPLFFNPGIPVITIDNVSDTIIIEGNVVDAYIVGETIQITNSTIANNNEWTIASVAYDGGNNRTNISVVEDIPDADSSGNAFIHTSIFQNYSRDLGVVWGAVYDPDVTTYNTNQVKTIIIPASPVNSNITGISYKWVGPIRMELSVNRQNNLSSTILDGLGVSDELIAVPDSFNIIFTNKAENFFVINHVDPDTGLPVNLTDSFSPRTIFDVKGSYSNSEPSNIETNDAKYVVLQSYFDDANNIFVATGGETKVIFDNFNVTYSVYKNGILLNEGIDYAITGPNELCFADPADCPATGFALSAGDVITQVPSSVPISWALGTGNTIIQIDSEYDNIPPYNNFNVVEVSNNAGDPDLPNTLTLQGDYVNLFNRFASNVFRLDIPLVSTTQLYNVITVTNIALVSGNTVLTIQEEFIDENYTGSLGIIEVAYSGNIFYDNTNTVTPWVDGTVFREVFRIDQEDNTLTATAIEDKLMFGWGTVVQWDIVVTDRTANFETIDIDGNPATPDAQLYRGSISIDGDQTGAIELNDDFIIRGSAGNDGQYEVASKIYNVINDDTDIIPRNQPRTYEVTTIADVAGNLNNTYFYISTPSAQYYVWMDVDNTGTDPLIPGKLGINVHVPTDATADTIAANLEYALVQSGAFKAYASNNLVIIDVITSGNPQQYAVDNNTNFNVVNYTISRQPAIDQQGIFELTNVDITDWYQYLIQQLNPATNEIVIIGNAIGDIQNGQQVRVVGTNNNDRIYTLSSIPTYDPTSTTTIAPVTETVNYGINNIVEILSDTQIKVLGNSARFLDGDDIINIVGSSNNDGTYTIVGVEQQSPYSLLTLSTSLNDNTPDGDIQYMDRGGWIEAVRHQGIHIFCDDLIGVNTVENVDAVILTTSLGFVDSWDANYWDIGSFDENLGTVIHLYSNTF